MRDTKSLTINSHVLYVKSKRFKSCGEDEPRGKIIRKNKWKRETQKA